MGLKRGSPESSYQQHLKLRFGSTKRCVLTPRRTSVRMLAQIEDSTADFRQMRRVPSVFIRRLVPLRDDIGLILRGEHVGIFLQDLLRQ